MRDAEKKQARPVSFDAYGASGMAVPGVAKLGFLPDVSLRPGSLGLMSKSGTLSYEAGYRLAERDMSPTTLHGVARLLLGALGLSLLALAALLLVESLPISAAWVALSGAILLVAAVYEHGRYQAAVAADRSGFQRTEEVFTDPTSGQRMRVWFDPATGQRDYRPEG